jgi:hypothetical protein
MNNLIEKYTYYLIISSNILVFITIIFNLPIRIYYSQYGKKINNKIYPLITIKFNKESCYYGYYYKFNY